MYKEFLALYPEVHRKRLLFLSRRFEKGSMEEVTLETDFKLWMKVKVKLLSRVQLFGTPGMVVTYQAPPSMGFSRQEYWSGLPFPSPGDLPDPGIEPGSPGEFHEQRSLVGLQVRGV